MGTPGMAFVRIDGKFKRFSTHFDGGLGGMGLGLAKTIQAMDPEALAEAARKYQCVKSNHAERYAPLVSKLSACSLFAEACGGRLGAEWTEALRASRLLSHFGIPYTGLGASLLAGRGRDPGNCHASYHFLVDIDNSRFALLRGPDELTFSFSLDFRALRAIGDDGKLNEAFDAIDDLLRGRSGEADLDIQAEVEAIAAKAAGPTTEKAPKRPPQAKSRAKIAQLHAERPEDFPEDPERWCSSDFFEIPSLFELAVLRGSLARLGRRDPFAQALFEDSDYGRGRKGESPPVMNFARVRRAREEDSAPFDAAADQFLNAMSMFGFRHGAAVGPADPKAEPAPPKAAPAGPLAPEDTFGLLREQWLPGAKIALSKPKQLRSWARFALGTCDSELLDMIGPIGAQKLFSDSASDIADLASWGAIGARLAGSINPKEALAFVDGLARGPFAPLAGAARALDKEWIDPKQAPATLAKVSASLSESSEGRLRSIAANKKARAQRELLAAQSAPAKPQARSP